MTTRRALPAEALTRVARALRFALLVQRAVRWAVLSAGALLALLVLDNLLHLPQALRLPLVVVLMGFVAVEFYRRVLTLALRPFSPAQAARWLETNRGIGGNVLINAYQFEHEQSRAEWKNYVSPVVASSKSILDDIPPRTLWLTPLLKKWLIGLALIIVAWAALVLVFPRYVVTGMERIFLPLSDVPPVGKWNIEVTPSGHVTLVEGDKLDIVAKLTSATGLKEATSGATLVWQNGDGESSSGEKAAMLPTGRAKEFAFSFSAVNRPFRFSVVADDSRSASVRVDVKPLPQIKGSSFDVTPPAYTGLKPFAQPGPPASLDVPAGSTVKATVNLTAESPKVSWRNGTAAVDKLDELTRGDKGWQITRLVNDSGAYEMLVSLPDLGEPRVLGRGQITAVPDRPPEIDFVTQDRNRALMPGATMPVTIKATDDYGVASIALQVSSSDDPASARAIRAPWNYVGPPGEKEPVPETYTIQLDSAIFVPGGTYLVTAQATDFSPSHQRTTSRPIVVRVASLQDMAVPDGDALAKLFELLRTTIVQQTQSNGQTDNLKLHLAEARQANDLAKHFDVMTSTQKQAQDSGNAVIAEAVAHDEGKVYVPKLQSLIGGEMGLALGQIGQLPAAKDDGMASGLDALQKRQVYILNSLIALLGQVANDRQQAAESRAKKSAETPPPIAQQQELEKLKDELKAFGDAQKKIIDATKPLMELKPEDLTTDQQALLGALAREEAKQAAFFQEKLTDLSKLPLQDFGDGKLVNDMNEVYQEVQKAATDLYQKRTDIAVPSEVAGLEKAAEIEQNLERWLPNTPDTTRWAMEEPQSQQDVPMAELPKELDDLVGDLLKQEETMDKDDPSSTILDSIDKGAGWGAGDGPMSNMSAKGVTGNQLPNNDEITGRSGEGRNGKSDGQMVGNTAVGKGGNETPTRMTPTPFENGSVNDQSKDTKGGATGGGKLAGFGQEGLRGPMSPPVAQHLQVLADQQAKLRQQTESLALQLRQQRKPTGDLESAINAMKDFETAARNRNGMAVVQGYHQALDSLQAARSAYAGDKLSRVEGDTLHRNTRTNVNDTQAEEAPAGYEEMTGAYFRSLSEAPAETPPAK